VHPAATCAFSSLLIALLLLPLLLLQAIEAVLSMQAAVDASGSNMRILVASIRAAEQMAILAANVSL
jgi:hypothetical protein